MLAVGMVIKTRYENGVFKPLTEVTLMEGAVLDIELPKAARRRSSLKRSGFAGMWKDREDIEDGLSYEDRLRRRPRA